MTQLDGQAGTTSIGVTIEMAEAGVRAYDSWADSNTDHGMGGIVHPASGLVVEIYKEMERVKRHGDEGIP